MLVLENYEDILNIAERGENVSIDLSQLNYLDYTKSIDFIKNMEIMIKKLQEVSLCLYMNRSYYGFI